VMNDTFSMKKCSQFFFYPQFLHSHFLSFRFLWTQSSCTLTFCFSINILHCTHFSTFQMFQ
jgi:hypothetical protein